MRFANNKKNWLNARRLFGERKDNGTALAQRVSGELDGGMDSPPDAQGDRTIQIPTTGDPTQRLLTALGRFQRQVARAESGAPQGQWVDECMNQLIAGIELANSQDWGDVMEALTDTARVLASYEGAGKAAHCVRFLQDSYEILCLMVGDLIVDNLRSGVMDKWRARFDRAVEDLAALGIELIRDDDDHEAGDLPQQHAPQEESCEDDDCGPAPWESEQALHPEAPQRPALRILERPEISDTAPQETCEAPDSAETTQNFDTDTMRVEEPLEEDAPFDDPLTTRVLNAPGEEDGEAPPMDFDERNEAPLPLIADGPETAREDLPDTIDEDAGGLEGQPSPDNGDPYSSAQQSLFDGLEDDLAAREAGQPSAGSQEVAAAPDLEMASAPVGEPAIEDIPECEPVEDAEPAAPALAIEAPEVAEESASAPHLDPEEPEPDSPEALLYTTQRALSAGNVADAKLLALELAARMARMEADRAAAHVADCEHRITQTHEAITRAQESVAACEQTLKETEDTVAGRCKDHEDCRGVLDALQGELNTIDGRISEIDAQIRALQEQRGETLAQRESVQAKYGEAETEAVRVQAEADATRTAAREASERLEIARDDVRQLLETQAAYERERETTSAMSAQRAKSVGEIMHTIENVKNMVQQAGGGGETAL